MCIINALPLHVQVNCYMVVFIPFFSPLFPWQLAKQNAALNLGEGEIELFTVNNIRFPHKRRKKAKFLVSLVGIHYHPRDNSLSLRSCS